MATMNAVRPSFRGAWALMGAGAAVTLGKRAPTSNDSGDIGRWGLLRPPLPPQRRDDAVLLVSDIDGTLTGDTGALHILNQHWLARQLPRGSVLVYNTARPLHFYESCLGSQELPPLLRPDVLIVAEGAEVWRFGEGAGPVRDEEWDAIVLARWDLARVVKACAEWDEKLITGLNDNEDRRFTVTVSSPDRAATAAAALERSLGDGYTVVNSQSWIPGTRNVTVLPAVSDKGNAAEFVRESLGFRVSRSVWAGDTKGDASMAETQLRGIVVGNASDELPAEVKMHGGSQIYVASASHAAGVLEGLRHHRLDIE